MVFSGISQHPSEGFPGGGAALRPTPGGAFRLSEGARTGPFWCQKTSEKSVLNSTYFGPLFSTFQRPSRARSGAQIRRNTDLTKICIFERTHPNIQKKWTAMWRKIFLNDVRYPTLSLRSLRASFRAPLRPALPLVPYEHRQPFVPKRKPSKCSARGHIGRRRSSKACP